jgi:hypothetical protein
MAVFFTAHFAKELGTITKYIHELSPQACQDFLLELNQLVYVKIPPQPFRYPEFSILRTQAKVFRKAIFKKKWNVVYKVEPNRLLFISIFHSSRDSSKMKFDY